MSAEFTPDWIRIQIMSALMKQPGVLHDPNQMVAAIEVAANKIHDGLKAAIVDLFDRHRHPERKLKHIAW